MKKKLVVLVALLLGGIIISSCATLFGNQNHSLDLVSSPEGAEVYINGEYMGTTPLQLTVKADKPLRVEFRKSGKAPIIRYVNNKVEAKWVVLDVLGGLIPVAIDAVTGNWYTLDTNKVNVLFEKK